MLFLRLTPDEAPDLLTLLVRNGKNKLARQLRNIISDKLFDAEESQAANSSRIGEWLEHQQNLISNLEKEDKNVSENREVS